MSGAEFVCPEHELLMCGEGFAGEGGATKGLMDAGFCVTAVDNDANRLEKNPAHHKVLGDAVEFLANEGHRFALRWGSPTCTGYSRGTAAIPDRVAKYDRLIAATREALLLHEGLWVIENVEDAAHLGEIRNAQMLCGRMFGLGANDLDGEPLILDRHRVFEANFDIEAPGHATHGDEVVAGAYGGGRRAKRRPQETIVELAARDRHEARYVRKGGYVPRDQGVLEQMLGITWEMTQKGVYLCIPPVYAEHIGRRAMAAHSGGSRMTTAAQATRQLAILTAMVGRHEVTNAADLVACDEPAPTTRTPRDPDGLAAENARERQSRWFEC